MPPEDGRARSTPALLKVGDGSQGYWRVVVSKSGGETQLQEWQPAAREHPLLAKQRPTSSL